MFVISCVERSSALFAFAPSHHVRMEGQFLDCQVALRYVCLRPIYENVRQKLGGGGIPSRVIARCTHVGALLSPDEKESRRALICEDARYRVKGHDVQRASLRARQFCYCQARSRFVPFSECLSRSVSLASLASIPPSPFSQKVLKYTIISRGIPPE